MAAIYSAASADPRLRAVRDESRRRHRDGCSRVAGRLEALDAPREGVDVPTAADVLAGLTDPQVARTFAIEYGWGWDRWREWALSALTHLLRG